MLSTKAFVFFSRSVVFSPLLGFWVTHNLCAVIFPFFFVEIFLSSLKDDFEVSGVVCPMAVELFADEVDVEGDKDDASLGVACSKASGASSTRPSWKTLRCTPTRSVTHDITKRPALI